jgi:putative N-acetylmannosamine-6-phosphate epimerase
LDTTTKTTQAAAGAGADGLRIERVVDRQSPIKINF